MRKVQKNCNEFEQMQAENLGYFVILTQPENWTLLANHLLLNFFH